MANKTKYIFVTGGVVSSLGKGIVAASLASILKENGNRVSIQKFDPYLNVDPGTMSPYEHGEVYVTGDGAETDLDLGHYERFLGIELNKHSNITSGRIYFDLISAERRGDLLGKTAQVIPHVTDSIKEKIKAASKERDVDVVITEIGGTVGDIESTPFIEAIRQFKMEHPEDVMFIHITLVPYLEAAKELKSKPTQQSIKALNTLGIFPDIVVLRTSKPIPKKIKEKIALQSSIQVKRIFVSEDMDNIYKVPNYLHKQKLGQEVVKILKMKPITGELTK
jgi:CTP synthase